MNSLDLIKDLYKYNSDVRKKYIERIFKLPADERYKDRGASFPSLVDILMHIVDAYRWWFLFALNDKLSGYKSLRGKKLYTKEELEDEERKIDSYVADFVSRLREDELDRDVEFENRGEKVSIKMRHILVHLIEEELQHRGELNALLWQMDIEPPITEYEDWKVSKSD
ncbi:MAG: DinB family protein [Conexivisphaerales archaeon]